MLFGELFVESEEGFFVRKLGLARRVTVDEGESGMVEVEIEDGFDEGGLGVDVVD